MTDEYGPIWLNINRMQHAQYRAWDMPPVTWTPEKDLQVRRFMTGEIRAQSAANHFHGMTAARVKARAEVLMGMAMGRIG